MFIFLITIIFSSYLLIKFNSNSKKLANSVLTTLSPLNLSCLLDNNTIVSFEIDDITFGGDEATTLNNALYLANEYGITFDLGVIAEPFSEDMDNGTYSIYQDNQNIFEVIAHGFTHSLDQSIVDNTSTGTYGEFYIFPINQNVPYSIQGYHIKEMKQIFQNYNLTTATEIFTIPYHTGDFNTTLLAEKYGYKLIIQKITTPKSFSEIKFGNITSSQDYIDIPLNSSFTEKDVLNYTSQLNQAIKMGQREIDISLHPINFDDLSNIDNFFYQILSQTNDSNIDYDMLSDRFNCNR